MTTVKICDAIMGSGKTEAAISYMNSHPDDHFIYVTPYLEEAKRIKDGCPELSFVEPQNNTFASGFSKITHTQKLLSRGCNITTTHAAFCAYTEEMIEYLKEYNYTLIIDEALNVFHEQNISQCDIDMLETCGYIQRDGIVYTSTDKKYYGALNYTVKLTERGELYVAEDEEKPGSAKTYYYWVIPCDVLRAFGQAIVLTYMFEYQDFRYFMDLHSIPYEFIGIHYEDGKYEFADAPDYVPEYVKTIKDKIHICDNRKMNEIGDSRWALSKHWYDVNPDGAKKVKDNMYNFYHNIMKCSGKDVIWAAYKNVENSVMPKGCRSGMTRFNLRGTNNYRDRDVLAYCVNLFSHPAKKWFLLHSGFEINEDGVALSDMVQWVWRSAIRDGNEIWLYVPSRRMRTLFQNWLNSLAEGGDCHVEPIEYEEDEGCEDGYDYSEEYELL